MICHAKPAEPESGVQTKARTALTTSTASSSSHPLFWHLHVLFMPSIFRIIPNLIAIRLLLPAAAVPKIKSRPRKGMLG